jgi:catecholate siderophore receptor
VSTIRSTRAPLAGALLLALGQPAFAEASGEVPSTFAVQATDLDAVRVEGQRVDAPQSPKSTQPLVDTPKTVTILPEAVLRDQGVTTLRDALRNVPGISIQAGEGGVPAGDNLTLRGFSARTDLFVDGVRDIGGYARDPFNIEQVEVAKGPASTVTGRGSTGGSINLASKTARMDAFRRASASVGDNGLVRGTADLNQPLGDGNALRVNLMAHQSEVNGRDAVENDRWGVAPTLSFGLGSDTVTTLSLFHLEQDNVPDYGQPWVPSDNNVLVESRDGRSPVDRSNFYGLLDRDYEDTAADMATLVVDHAFGDALSLRNLTRWGRSTRDSIITAPRFLSDDDTAIRRTGKTRDSEDTILLNATDLRADFETGRVAHALVAGVEIARESSSNRYRAATEGDLADFFDPDPGVPYTGEVTRDPSRDASVDADALAVYVFDTLTLSPAWELSGGLRWDRFEVDTGEFARDDDMLSGQAAIVYKPAADGSVYLAYGTSFNPSAEGLSLNADTAALEPEESRTLELGTKWELAGNRLLLSAAVFRTEKTNARTEDADEIVVLEGEQRVDGFEVGVAGRVTDAWTLHGGYAYLDGEVLESRDPAEGGNRLGNTPRHSASLWSSHRIGTGWEVGYGVQHVGARYSNTSNTRRAKAYTLHDAMVSWQATDALALRLNGYNLFDKDHVDQVGGGHYVPGAGRTFMLSADVSF